MKNDKETQSALNISILPYFNITWGCPTGRIAGNSL
jgi:hypothetical protein